MFPPFMGSSDSAGQASGPGSEAMLAISRLWPGHSSHGPWSSPANPAPTHAHRISWDPFLFSSLFLKGFEVRSEQAGLPLGGSPASPPPALCSFCLPAEKVLDTSISKMSALRLLPVTDTKLRQLTSQGCSARKSSSRPALSPWSQDTLCLGSDESPVHYVVKEGLELASLLPLPPEVFNVPLHSVCGPGTRTQGVMSY